MTDYCGHPLLAGTSYQRRRLGHREGNYCSHAIVIPSFAELALPNVEAVVPPPPAGDGVRKSVRLSDFSDANARQRASDFIKAQLALDKQRAETPVKTKKAKAFKAGKAKAEIIENTEEQLIIENNNRIMLMLLSQ